MNEVPGFVKDYIQEARRLFGVNGEDWHFYVKMTDRPGGHSESEGFCQSDSTYMIAEIELKDYLGEGEITRSHAFHEVLHAAHAEIDAVVDQMEDLIPKRERKIVRNFYNRALERFVQRTARSITYYVEPTKEEECPLEEPTCVQVDQEGD